MLGCIAGVLIHDKPLCAGSYHHLSIVSFLMLYSVKLNWLHCTTVSNTLPRETFLHNIGTLVDCGYGWDLLGNGKDG